MASGLRRRLVVVDSVAHVPPKAAQSWRLHSHVQYDYAHLPPFRHCLHHVYAQFFDAILYVVIQYGAL